LGRFIEKNLEHLGIGEEMQPALGRFWIGALRAKHLTRGAEPLEPCGVLRTKLVFEFFA
jgi:hypothetical protein